MFTGLVQQVGTLISASSGRLLIRPAHRIENPVTGESIAVNGCCLTLERVNAAGELEFHTLAETLNRSNLGKLAPGSPVNLERALALGDRLGGHLVQGHVDAVAEVVAQKRNSNGDVELVVRIPEGFAVELVEKGSITIDGVSLTVATLTEQTFSVCLIPQTLADTALASKKSGTFVNLEGDIIGKYVRRFLEVSNRSGSQKDTSSGITYEKLREAGFL
ncbi:MAG: riboflavin synthase [Lentisphaeria bacterium]|nr:riboflavin synthase [Lentisphaeria bacterium]